MRRAPLALLTMLALAAPAEARTVPGELARLRDAGQIDIARHDAWRATYDAAKATWRRLRGARRRELQGVLRTTERLAAGGRLTAARAPLVFGTLEHNRRWWAGGPLLPYGRRVTFSGSRLVWQMYPGQGLQLQWLATFGKANALFAARDRDEDLRALLDEALALAAPRAGGLGFEYMFTFDGGAPPWVSAIAQGTGVQALSRAAVRLGEPRFFEAARAATAPLAAAPPEGVRAPDGHLLMYSFAPRLRILNGFAQALVGLHDFATLANDDGGRTLFASGEARLRAELPAYDTGAWSLYRRHGHSQSSATGAGGAEASLSYHVLQRDFLRNLCRRLTEHGGADPDVYCAAAARFTTYLRTPPRVTVLPARLRVRRSGAVRIELDKRSSVTLTLRRGGRVVLRRSATVSRGRRSFRVRPRRAAPLHVHVRAIDLAGNAATATATVPVPARP